MPCYKAQQHRPRDVYYLLTRLPLLVDLIYIVSIVSRVSRPKHTISNMDHRTDERWPKPQYYTLGNVRLNVGDMAVTTTTYTVPTICTDCKHSFCHTEMNAGNLLLCNYPVQAIQSFAAM